ncbi:unnamed protein product [Medioppia subpectinata]|uniref:Peptidase M1 leukotriene A4 hydrolase/aminopeptidase C-terminal domain-containing protein n=1 Tax=Medioppia subpectinata TaxID=1979941 RepID=A0A7R9KUW0_9ACAR|nr:unnamed protein product [Medioppia subpectinata]CAG2108930.1 unnamed protein product [Medioppia subpectinata]
MTISYILSSIAVLLISLFFLFFRSNPTTRSDTMANTSATEALLDELRQNPVDPNSFARPDLSRVDHILWKAFVNFEKQTIGATVDLTVQKQTETVDEILLDTSGLSIDGVTDAQTGQPLNYTLSPSVAVFGAKLTVKLPASVRSTVRIAYRTSSKATALQWLKPEQTAGKRHPYLLSQCQAIHCRSILPIQDTPAVKQTYDAAIVAPKDLVVLMSAVRDGTGAVHQSDNSATKEYRFKQKIAIPSYLIAIAVGDLVSKEIGPRSHVWSEPALIDRCAYEFANTEKMLATAESIVGPYVWGVYDLLVLPPSFPFGGMENPCLTFVTPTLLAGDRSLESVVAHEIAHSWTGNLVTNKNWGHFWLNEGFTTFLENKIVGRLSGGEPNRQFRAFEGLKSLKNDIDNLGRDSPFTKLLIDHRGVDPDDAFSTVPYYKGHTFLFYLEQLLGGPEVFEPFLRTYIDNFKYKVIETNDFRSFLQNYFSDNKEALSRIDWGLWINGTGMPHIIPDYDQTLAKECIELANRWIAAADTDWSQFRANDISAMDAWQRVEFLNNLLAAPEGKISAAKVEAITRTYGLQDNHNSEIRCLWLRLSLAAHCKAYTADAVQFITSQGRMKFVKPIYKALYAWDETRQLAVDTFKANAHQLMDMSAKAVAKELHLNV